MRMKTSLLMALLLISLIMSLMAFLLPVSAAEAATDKQSAYNAIESAKQDMQEMQAAGFSVKKVNDTIADAKNLYDVQLMLEQKGEKADYFSVIAKANSVAEIRKDAFETHDALRALDLKLEEAGKSQDMSAAIEIFNEAKREFEDERYEQTREAIDRCYQKINELQAAFTKIKAIYKASTKTLVGFFARNYKLIIVIILVALVLYFTFKNKVAIYLVNRNIQRLQLEKETLTEMMQKTQFDYFQKGAMPESMYRVRETKFGELTRDIERRLSIERLELEDIKKRKGKRAEKIRKIAHEPSLRRPKAEIEKARKKEAKKRAKLRKKEEKRKAKLRKKEEKKEAKAEEERDKEERKRLKKLDFKKIKYYVQKTKSKGFSDNEIRAELARRGWQAELIKKAFRAFSEVKEKAAEEKADFKRVKDYIQKAKSMGFSDRRIKAGLAKSMWQSGFVKKAFGEVKKEAKKKAKEEKRKLKREKRIEKQRRKEAKKNAKLRKKAEKARLREKKKSAKQEKKEAAKRRKEVKRRLKEEKKRAKLRKKAEKAKPKEEAARKKEEEREKAEAVRQAERELAIRQKERKKQEKLARKKAIKRLREVKKEFERRKKEALRQKKLEKRKEKIKKKKSKKK